MHEGRYQLAAAVDEQVVVGLLFQASYFGGYITLNNLPVPPNALPRAGGHELGQAVDTVGKAVFIRPVEPGTAHGLVRDAAQQQFQLKLANFVVEIGTRSGRIFHYAV